MQYDFNDIKKLIVDVNRNNKRLNVNSQTINFLYCYYFLLQTHSFINDKGKIKNNELYSFTKTLIEMLDTINNSNFKVNYKLLNVNLYNGANFVKIKRNTNTNKFRYISDNNDKLHDYRYLFVYSKLIYEQEKTTCYPVSKDEIKNLSIKQLKEKYKYAHIQDPIKFETYKFINSYLPKKDIDNIIDKISLDFINELKMKAYKNNNIDTENKIYKFMKTKWYKELKNVIKFDCKNNPQTLYFVKKEIDTKIENIKNLIEEQRDRKE